MSDVHSEFADLLTDTVTITPKAGQDSYGRRTYGTAVSYSCRVQDAKKALRTPDGRDVVADGMVILLGNPPVTAEDRLVVNGAAVNILKVDNNHDERGPHHTLVYFGAT